MATFRERDGKYQAIIRRVGLPPLFKTFTTKTLAKTWAKGVEGTIEQGRAGIIGMQPTIGYVFEKFRDETSYARKGGKWERNRIDQILSANEHWKSIPSDRFDPERLREWVIDRITEVAKPSARREMSLMAGIFKQAIKGGWIKIPISPTKLVFWPDGSKPRKRTVSEAELTKIVGPIPEHETKLIKDYVPYVAWFAYETGLRMGELCQMTWSDIDVEKLTIYVRDEWSNDNRSGKSVKNGSSREVPLSPRAVTLINTLSQYNEDAPLEAKVFCLSPAVLDQYWSDLKDAAGFKGDIVFHDLRRTRLTIWAEKYEVNTLAKMSGHKDINTLVETYYQPKTEDLAARLHPAPELKAA